MPSVCTNADNKSRLLVVSNRLPITIKRKKAREYDFSMSTGGLVSGLSGLMKTFAFRWYGWADAEIPEDEVNCLKEKLEREYNAVPIMLEKQLADKHYNKCSSTGTLNYRTWDRANSTQTLSYGHSFTTVPRQLHSMNLRGRHIVKPTEFLQEQ